MKPLLFALLVGCPSTETPTEPTLSYSPVCETARTVPCIAEMTADLGLFPLISEGSVVEVVDGNDWVSTVDATAGGFIEAPARPWLYLAFTDDGLRKVDLTDEDALTSMDWDLAFHRFNVRLNGGVSGPSCVSAGSLPGMAYAEVELADAASATLAQEAFYDETCTFLNEDTGDEGAPTGVPTLVLQDWWDYPGCVATTGIPFAVQLASGRLLKLEILSYYAENQDQCNDSGTPGSDSANFDVRWTFLQ